MLLDENAVTLLRQVIFYELSLGLGLLLFFEVVFPYLPTSDHWNRAQHVANNLLLWLSRYFIVDVLLTPVVFPASALSTIAIWQVSWEGTPLWFQIVVGVLILDFFVWLLHWLSHRYRWLWLFHSVHHSDPHLDATTAVRNHPVEAIISLFWHAALLALIGLPIWILLFRALLAEPISLLHHSNVRIPEPFDRLMRTVFVSPAMHRVHHSPVMDETNSNYAIIFSFWDRLFGTYREPTSAQPSGFGLNALRAPSWQSLWGMLMTPVRARNIQIF